MSMCMSPCSGIVGNVNDECELSQARVFKFYLPGSFIQSCWQTDVHVDPIIEVLWTFLPHHTTPLVVNSLPAEFIWRNIRSYLNFLSIVGAEVS